MAHTADSPVLLDDDWIEAACFWSLCTRLTLIHNEPGSRSSGGTTRSCVFALLEAITIKSQYGIPKHGRERKRKTMVCLNKRIDPV